MTKTLLSAALIAGLGIAAFAPQAAYAVDGTITFSGQVDLTTCKVTNSSLTVQLPTVSATALNAPGATAGNKAFSISLTGCTAGTKATTFFEPGPNVVALTGNLKNTNAGAKVDVRLLNSDFSVINLAAAAGSQNSQQITTDATGAGSLNYYAQYYANAAATGSAVNTSVQFTMQYQ